MIISIGTSSRLALVFIVPPMSICLSLVRPYLHVTSEIGFVMFEITLICSGIQSLQSLQIKWHLTFVKLILISLSLHFWHTVLIDFCFPNEEKWMVQAVQTSAVFLNHFWGNLIPRLVVCVLSGFMQHADLIYHYMAMASMAMCPGCLLHNL